jgi:heme-degrading monooxygenase HmoA
MKALPIHEGAFSVLLVFQCSSRESEQLAHALAEFIESRMRFHAGFLSSLVYISEDASRVVELFQWARAEDWEAYRASEDGREAVERAASHKPKIEFLELIHATGAPPPGTSGAPQSST